jgi:hypothetical protein
LFIRRVHQLVQLGYDRLHPAKYAADEETAITGDLVEAIDATLDDPAAQWMRFYSIHDDPPENQPRRRGQQRRRGRERKRVDIRLACSERSPRTRFRFECKRLADNRSVARYLGKDGLGCFLRSDYASGDMRAGMIGYMQADDEETWAGEIEQQLNQSPQAYSLQETGRWRREPIIAELQHTYLSTHRRGRGHRPIDIYHTLLRFW